MEEPAKQRLHRWCQQNNHEQPHYAAQQNGAFWIVECTLPWNTTTRFVGKAATKREAEHYAAQQVLDSNALRDCKFKHILVDERVLQTMNELLYVGRDNKLSVEIISGGRGEVAPTVAFPLKVFHVTRVPDNCLQVRAGQISQSMASDSVLVIVAREGLAHSVAKALVQIDPNLQDRVMWCASFGDAINV
jgi:hypothetical protein